MRTSSAVPRPFGAVVVRNSEILATGVNEVISTNDPTAHAELMAIRAASQKLGSPNLVGCAVFASGHPCPMCMAAMRNADSVHGDLHEQTEGRAAVRERAVRQRANAADVAQIDAVVARTDICLVAPESDAHRLAAHR